jgi:hypothetical protein
MTAVTCHYHYTRVQVKQLLAVQCADELALVSHVYLLVASSASARSRLEALCVVRTIAKGSS